MYRWILREAVQSVTVTLEDELDGDAGSNMSISMSDVVYCQQTGSCTDSDNDGVCDAQDLCPGFDDNLDADGDGIPDGCDDCNTQTDQFSPNPLTHTGTGSSASNLTFSSLREDVTFTVSNLDAKTNGRADRRYIEVVTVSYVDGNSNTQTYGTFSGDNTSSFMVNIPGPVSALTITLTDGYDGDSGSTELRVNISDVSSCEPESPALRNGRKPGVAKSGEELHGYPNPTHQEIMVEWTAMPVDAVLVVNDLHGRPLLRQRIPAGTTRAVVDLENLPGAAVYLITLRREGRIIATYPVVKL